MFKILSNLVTIFDRKYTVYKSFPSSSTDDNDDVKMTRFNTSESSETM